MTVESWKSICDTGTVILTFLLFAFGAGALVTGRIINKLQDARIHSLSEDLKEKDSQIVLLKAGQLNTQSDLDIVKPKVESIQHGLSPRRILIPKNLFDKLADFNTVEVWTESRESDEDGSALRDQLVTLLSKLPNPIPTTSSFVVGPSHSLLVLPGIHIRYRASTLSKQLAERLGNVFSSSGIAFDIGPATEKDIGTSERMDNAGKERVIVSIGRKP